MSEILFELDEWLADPREPEAAWCPECKEIQPIENFKRYPSALQAANWGWHGLRDMKHAQYTGTECNECFTRTKMNSTSVDYAAYDKELRLSGRYEYLVPDPREPLHKNLYVTKREEMVISLRAKRGEGRIRGGIKGYRRRQAPQYSALLREIRLEKQRVYQWKNNMKGLSQDALDFRELYLEYITTLASRIRDAKGADKPKAALAYVEGYMDKEAKLDKDVSATFRDLSSVERERMKPRYVL